MYDNLHKAYRSLNRREFANELPETPIFATVSRGPAIRCRSRNVYHVNPHQDVTEADLIVAMTHALWGRVQQDYVPQAVQSDIKARIRPIASPKTILHEALPEIQQVRATRNRNLTKYECICGQIIRGTNVDAICARCNQKFEEANTHAVSTHDVGASR